MSVQFGKCNFDGRPVDPRDLDEVRPLLAPYGPDAEGCLCKDNYGILYRAFHTTKESRRETQPHVSKSSAVITWDGRLDNREELIQRLGGGLSAGSTDLEIVAAGYERWGTNAFAALVGDWAISVWNPKDQSLVLVKDFIGTRHLYYSVDKYRAAWCTILDPLVLFAERSFKLEEEYIAGWLAFFPATHLPPYVGIDSVPPSCFVRLTKEARQVNKYWDFKPAKKIRYRTDREFEEHFQHVFSTSIRRRLRSDNPVLAELSGGMDSSSIVCMADEIIRQGRAATPTMHTVSYYDDSEPNWNERPYFTKVEQLRGRTGCHIDVGSSDRGYFDYDAGSFAALPQSGGLPVRAAKQLETCMRSQQNRVVLSGLGGDEFNGGVPTAIPELADLLVDLRFSALAGKLKLWALNKRKPWFRLLLETTRRFLPVGCAAGQLAAWLHPSFVRRNAAALAGSETRLSVRGPLPSFQENLRALDGVQRQLACTGLQSDLPREIRHPYLDRCLLEFLFAIPRQQLVRPGQRRSLMRRALSGIVPEEILHRRRKAYIARSPMVAISTEWISLVETCEHMLASSLEIIDARRFSETLQMARSGIEIPIGIVARTLSLEFWLRGLPDRNLQLGGRAKEPLESGEPIGFLRGELPESRENEQVSAS